MALIEVSHLAKNFGSFHAVKDVSFHVNEGDVFGFLGPNGAGKSTTIRCLLSLIRPTDGEIKFFGKSLNQDRSEVLTRVGCIIEKPDFYKYLSAQRNLEIFARISGKDITKRQIQEMIDFVGLNGREGDKVSGFSHGMKQRLGIAQTLLHNPDVIILDDFGLQALDSHNRITLLEIIEDRHNNGSIIVTSQIPVQGWYDIIGEKTIADAILDRLIHQSHRLELKGESMRKKRGTNKV